MLDRAKERLRQRPPDESRRSRATFEASLFRTGRSTSCLLLPCCTTFEPTGVAGCLHCLSPDASGRWLRVGVRSGRQFDPCGPALDAPEVRRVPDPTPGRSGTGTTCSPTSTRKTRPDPLLFQLDLLRQVGFADVEVLHKSLCFAAFGAVKGYYPGPQDDPTSPERQRRDPIAALRACRIFHAGVIR